MIRSRSWGWAVCALAVVAACGPVTINAGDGQNGDATPPPSIPREGERDDAASPAGGDRDASTTADATIDGGASDASTTTDAPTSSDGSTAGDTGTTDASDGGASPDASDAGAGTGDSGGGDASPGGDAGADAGFTCEPGTTRCNGNGVETCSAMGQWGSASSCTYACLAGACTGVCTPGSKRCTGLVPETCDGSGQWFSDAACSNTCSWGSCAGCNAGACYPACTLGAKRCYTANGGTIYPQTCGTSPSGPAWWNGPACTNGCVDGACLPAAPACNPGEATCSGTSTLFSCSTGGQWQSSTCPYVCQNGACTGVCAPNVNECVGDTRRSCDGSGQLSETTCAYGCFDGQCSTGTCNANVSSPRCTNAGVPQRCVAGQWANQPLCRAGETCDGGTCYANYVAIGAGEHHICAIHRDGTVRCWGSSAGGLGDVAATKKSATPITVANVSTAARVVGGLDFTCVVRADNQVACWGSNTRGQLGIGSFTSRATPGPVVQLQGGAPLILNDAFSVSIGSAHVLAKTNNNEARGWGDASKGQLPGLSSAINEARPLGSMFSSGGAVAARHNLTCLMGLGGGNSIACHGRYGSTPIVTTSVSGASGPGNYMAVDDNGAYAKTSSGWFTWSFSAGAPTVAQSISAPPGDVIIRGDNYCARAGGDVYCWGANSKGQVGNGSTSPQATPVLVLSDVADLAMAEETACALKADGTVWCWGSNEEAEAGQATGTIVTTPTRVLGL